MSPEKTLITHGHDKARFRGYDITISKNQVTKRKTDGQTARVWGASYPKRWCRKRTPDACGKKRLAKMTPSPWRASMLIYTIISLF